MKFDTEMSKAIFESKYMIKGVDKTPDDSVERIVQVVSRYYPEIENEVRDIIKKKWVGIAGGLWRSAMNPNQNVSSINCTTLDQPNDSLESIKEAWYWWAKFAAYGQGEGVDLSKLRPKGAELHNSANKSTGAVSFMHTFDGILNIIAQQGRRGASLISLNIKHPDVPDFITVKDQEGVLESANISLHITDDFMQAVIDGTEWEFSFTNQYETISRKTDARNLFTFLAEHAHKSGDPGVQFIDVVRKYSNSDYLGYPVVSTNACSEQWLDPHNVCLLSSINLAKFKEYGYEGYKQLIHLMVRVLDAFRMYEIEEQRSPSALQLEKLNKLPRIGLGVTGLADFFIDKRIEYASPDSLIEARKLFSLLAGESYKASYEIAKNRGYSFEWYDKEKYKQSPFVQRLLSEGLIEDYHLDYQAHVCKTTVAPNGTLTEVVEAGGGGVEPIFAKYFVRRERSTTGDWKEWFTFNHAVRNALNELNLPVTKENVERVLNQPWWVTAHSVDNHKKIELMSIIQEYIDSAISITYNLPESATPKDIEDIYFRAWEKEIKAVSVFRENSKKGILITDANYEKTKTLEASVIDNNRFTTKRPEVVECDIHEIKVGGVPHTVLVGTIENQPYELFVTHDSQIDLQKQKKGYIRKTKKHHYDLLIEENGNQRVLIENINKTFDSEYGSLSRFISMSLRHQVPIEFIVDQLAKDKNFVGFERSVGRVLKKYIKEGERVKTSDLCEECQSELIFSGGCKSCPNCGWSKCD